MEQLYELFSFVFMIPSILSKNIYIKKDMKKKRLKNRLKNFVQKIRSKNSFRKFVQKNCFLNFNEILSQNSTKFCTFFNFKSAKDH